MSGRLGNCICIQVRAVVRQVSYSLIFIVKAFIKYFNVSPSSQDIHLHNNNESEDQQTQSHLIINMPTPIESQDQQTQSQHIINIPTPISHNSIHIPEASSRANPIMWLFQSKNISKLVLDFAMPMATGLLFNQYEDLTLLEARLIAIALLLGFSATWNGMLLRGMYPRAASVMEIFGVALVIVALYGLISSILPPTLVWTSWLCCGLSCLPLVWSLLPLQSAEETVRLNSTSSLPRV